MMNRVHALGFLTWLQTMFTGKKKRVADIVDYVFTPDGKRAEAPRRTGTYFLTVSPVSVTMTEVCDGKEVVITRKRWQRIQNHMMDNILADLGSLTGLPVRTRTYLDGDGIMWRHQTFAGRPDSVTVHRPANQIIFCEMQLV